MKTLVLKKRHVLAFEDRSKPETPGPGQVLVKVAAVGICGSDVHYFEEGRIGDFVVRAPLVLGHETAGIVEAAGEGVRLTAGDRVAMEPGVPCGACSSCRSGRYNLCPDIRFWATPPVDGTLAEYVVHPEAFCYRLPESMGIDEGALIEPLAVGVHACNRGRVRPGDVVAINGAGTIGSMALLSARAFGAKAVVVADVVPERLARAASLGADAVVDVRSGSLAEAVKNLGGPGADVGIECSGHPSGVDALVKAAAPGGRIVLVGMGPQPTPFDAVAAMVKELDVLTVFRYAHAYSVAIDLVATGRISLKGMITDRFKFDDALSAFEFARNPLPGTGKILIEL